MPYNPKSLENLRPPWKPGQSGNEGRPHPGKRISTWMAELGQMKLSELPKENDLPLNGRIALARIKAALTENGSRDTEILLDRTEGKQLTHVAAPLEIPEPFLNGESKNANGDWQSTTNA